MAILQINKIDIADPQTLTWDIYDLDGEDGAGRTQDGLMHRDRVAVKRKLNCTWSPMTNEEIKFIEELKKDKMVYDILFSDPKRGADLIKKKIG